MAELVLPDSSFYISCARAGRDPFVALSSHLDKMEFATCGMVILEVCRGRTNQEVLRHFRERFAIMPFIAAGVTTWERAAQLAWTLDRRGQVLPAPDLLIAACALQAGATVLSNDGHYRSIPGLKVIERLE